MEKLKDYVGKKELRMLEIGALGQGMIYAIMSSYISDFYLNVLGVSAVFVSWLMLLARVWDAINDPIMGMIADRLNPKHGKMRIYLLITPVPIALLTCMLFYSPDLSLTGKMVYASITYVLWGMIYTMSDVPFWSLPILMTPNPTERGRVFSLARTSNGIGSALPIVIFLTLGFLLPKAGLSGIELEKTRYTIISLFAAVLGNLLFANSYFHVKERVNIPRKKPEKGEAGSLKLLFTNKPLMLVLAMGVLSCGRYMYQVGAIHVARYSFYIGGSLTGKTGKEVTEALQSNISKVNLVFAVATAVGMFTTMLLIPKLIKRFNYKQIVIASCLVGFAASVMIYFIGYRNFWACVPFLVFACVPAGAINVLSSAMIGDSLDYMEWKTGRRENGLGSACQSFVNKLGSALATTFISLMYKFINLNGDMINLAYTQGPDALPDSVRNGMFLVISIIPGVLLLLCAAPLVFYDLTGKKRQRITEELQLQRERRGIEIQ